jgi:hypothetical protein
MTTRSGQCKCGKVEYSFDGEIKTILNCHCNMCRQMNGTAYSTYVVIELASLSVTKGEARLAKYQVTEGGVKHYCLDCGTPLFNSNSIKYPGLAMLYLGALYGSAEVTPMINIYSESKLPWIDNPAQFRSFDQGPLRKK